MTTFGFPLDSATTFYDDTFIKDVLKILLQNGLLALIALIAGYQLNKLLEKRKTREIILQHLVKLKVDAYQQINKKFHQLNIVRGKIIAVISRLEESKSRNEIFNPVDVETFATVTGTFSNLLDEQVEVVITNSVHLSSELVEKLSSFSMNAQLGFIQMNSDNYLEWLKLLDNVNFLQAQIDIQKQIFKEVEGIK